MSWSRVNLHTLRLGIWPGYHMRMKLGSARIYEVKREGRVASRDGRQPSEDKYFEREKGKGPVAKDLISEGQVVWKEDPFVIAPSGESTLNTFPSPISPPKVQSVFFIWSTGRFMICSPCPAHMHTAPYLSRTAISHHISYTAQQHRAQPRAAAHAPHASATASASNGQKRLIRCSAPRRTPRACHSCHSRGNMCGWGFMCSRSVRRACSSHINRSRSRGVSGLESAVVIMRKRVCARIGRLRTSEWRSG